MFLYKKYKVKIINWDKLIELWEVGFPGDGENEKKKMVFVYISFASIYICNQCIYSLFYNIYYANQCQKVYRCFTNGNQISRCGIARKNSN